MRNYPSGLKDRVAVVTGGGRGIGKAISATLFQTGARVVVADVDEDSAERAAKEISGSPGEAIGCFVDVGLEESVSSLMQRALKTYGRIDILVNNAGIMYRTRLMDISSDEWEQTMRINLTGVFFCTKAVLPIMKKSQFGRIVNIASSAGRSVSTLGGAHYTASKAGLLGLTRAAAKEVAPLGITVNAICPGLIETKMALATTTPEELQRFLDSFPVSRLGSPEEIGHLVAFLCSDEAAYITGASLDINGGDLMI